MMDCADVDRLGERLHDGRRTKGGERLGGRVSSHVLSSFLSLHMFTFRRPNLLPCHPRVYRQASTRNYPFKTGGISAKYAAWFIVQSTGDTKLNASSYRG